MPTCTNQIIEDSLEPEKTYDDLEQEMWFSQEEINKLFTKIHERLCSCSKMASKWNRHSRFVELAKKYGVE